MRSFTALPLLFCFWFWQGCSGFRLYSTGEEMNDLSVEEIIAMLYGIKLAAGLSRAEKEVLQAAIDHLERGEDGNEY